jgi:hypothetical protein
LWVGAGTAEFFFAPPIVLLQANCQPWRARDRNNDERIVLMKNFILLAAAVLAFALTASKAQAASCDIDQAGHADLRGEMQDCASGNVAVAYLDMRHRSKSHGADKGTGQFKAQRVRSVRLPQFNDYPATIYSGRTRQPDMASDPDARTYRTRLRDAAKGPVNFAGEYVLATWGCGTTCLMGAVINARTGHVAFLPHSVCCWDADSGTPIDYRADSNLIVFTGLLDEQDPNATHYFEFSRGQFHYLTKEAAARGGQEAGPESYPRTQSSAQPMASAGADTDVTDFTLINDLPFHITVNWLDGQAKEIRSEGGDQTGTRPWVSPGQSWRVERGARTWESHWFAVVSQQGFVCSFSPRQGETVRLSELQACSKGYSGNRPQNKPKTSAKQPRSKQQVSGKSAECFSTDDGNYPCTFKSTDNKGSFESSAPGKPTFNLFVDRPGEASASADFGTGRSVSLPGMFIRQTDDRACWKNDETKVVLCVW